MQLLLDKMDKAEIIDQIKQNEIVPIVRTSTEIEAEEIIEKIRLKGFRFLEITLTTPNAVNLIEKFSAKQDFIVGAGTVTDLMAAERCLAAGAKFIVSPCFNPDVIDFCNSNSVTVIPGALTPTEIFAAHQAGADLVKVFPVSAVGGAGYIKAIKSVFPQISIMATGGISIENAPEFFSVGTAAVGIGKLF